MREETGAAVRLADYRPHDYRIDAISLTVDLAAKSTRVRAVSHVRRRAMAACPLVLDGGRFGLTRVAIDGVELGPDAYAVGLETLTIHAPPEAFSLEIDTLLDPSGNTALEGLYMSGGRYCTQCEAEGFRRITYAIDRPDNLAVFEVRIEADKAGYPTLLSNGDPIAAGDLEGGRHFAVWRDPHPKPTYLFALVAGAFDSIEDTFQTASGRTVRLGVHVDPGDGPRADYAMDALKRSMAWDEKAFGREYDLDVFNIVAVRDFNFGAMENKGLNVFNSAYVLADAESATDADYEAIESIVAHEYFHNWTGNRITLRDWFQLCLKEGLTVFRDQEFSADQRSRPVQRIKDVKRLRARQFAEDAGPLAHPVRPQAYQKIDNFYTATVYEKGAEVVRMLKALTGADAFAAGMALYFKRCDGKAATVEDFIACFAEASGRNLSQFMGWYAQAGTPKLTSRGEYDAEARRYRLTLRQETPPTPGQPDKKPLPIPLRIGFIAASGAILAARREGEEHARAEHAVAIDATETVLSFEGVVARPIPAILRGASAPVHLDSDLTEDDLLVQMGQDPDPVTRWDAGQILARRLILARATGAPGPDLEAFVAALEAEVGRADKDPAFTALALRLPDLPDLIQSVDQPDPDALHAAREIVRSAVARALLNALRVRADAGESGAFSADAASAGRRALKSAALDLLAALGEEEAHRLTGAFARASTMTEQMAALEALGASGSGLFDGALDIFHQRWRTRPLLVDKWFAVQAAAPRAETIHRVHALRAHDGFDLRNPNRVRALAVSFSLRNPRAFHAADGTGYRFLGEIVREADPLNPALAARLLGAFETWRRFDPGRRAHAQATLEGLLAAPSLSANAREILHRTLAEAGA